MKELEAETKCITKESTVFIPAGIEVKVTPKWKGGTIPFIGKTGMILCKLPGNNGCLFFDEENLKPI